jgi:hypothetical protein
MIQCQAKGSLWTKVRFSGSGRSVVMVTVKFLEARSLAQRMQLPVKAWIV